MNWDDMRLFLGLARNGRVAIAAKGLKVTYDINSSCKKTGGLIKLQVVRAN